MFEKAADVSLILVWLKIQDSIIDREKNIYRLLNKLFSNTIKDIFEKLPEKLYKDVIEYHNSLSLNEPIDVLSHKTNYLACSLFNYIISHIDMPIKVRKEVVHIAGKYGNLITELDYLIDIDKNSNSRSYTLIKNIFIKNILQTKEKIENLCEDKVINNYFKSCYFMAVKASFYKLK